MAETKILITGATGYIGGTILSALLASSKPALKNLRFSALIRAESQAAQLGALGVTPILFKNLDDVAVIRKAASEHDVVIHTASGFHTASAKALIEGLGDRKRDTGKDVYYLHTSGTSNLGDQPITGAYHESREFADTDDIYAYEKTREACDVYPQRTTDIAVVDTGRARGVKTHIIMSPTIYGLGTGGFNRTSIQEPTMIRASLKAGYVAVIGSGAGVWDYVHVVDLVDLYELLLDAILSGKAIPSGERGIYFSENGRFSWAQMSQSIADALHKADPAFPKEVKSVSLEEAAKLWGGGNVFVTELAFASNSRTKAVLGRELGWTPKFGASDFSGHLEVEVAEVLKASGA